MRTASALAALLLLASLACGDGKTTEVTGGMPLFENPASMQQRVARSEVIARVRFVSVEPAGVRDRIYRERSRDSDHNVVWGDYMGYVAALEYTFRVLEYMKGTGGAEIEAFAIGHIGGRGDDRTTDSTEAGARDKARALMAIRDNRWEGREGIVFLRKMAPEDHYVLDYLDLDAPRTSNVSVSDRDFKAWLPAVDDPATSTDSMRAASAGEQLYYVEDPYNVRVTTSGGARGASGGSRIIRLSPGRVTDELEALTSEDSGDSRDAYDRASSDSSIVVLPPETVALSAIRSVIAELDRKVRQSGNSEAAKRCLAETYWLRENSFFKPYDSYAPAIGSGQVTEGFYIARYIGDEPPQRPPGTPRKSFSWLGGPDAHRFEYVYRGRVLPVRPLPAGQYSIFYNEQALDWAACDFYPEEWRDTEEYPVAVVAPEGMLAESFFDPYTDGNAVTGTTTVGTISWQGGRVTADLDIDATGHALDFIGLDGTTTLSLIVADATETDGTLTWTVPTQPWSAGDKLMLRVRRHDAPTPTPTPTPTPAPTPIPTDNPSILFKDTLDPTVVALESLIMAVGEVAWVTVKAENLDPSGSYTIEVTRLNDEPSGGVGIVFHYRACYYTPQSRDVSGRTSSTRTMAVKLCTGTGGTVTAALKQGDTTLATTDLEVSTPS